MTKIISREDARQQGLNTYYTGVACKYGHFSDRRVSNKQCIQCVKEWQEKHRAEQNEKKRDNYRANPEPYLEKSKQQRLEKPEEVKEYKRKWRRSEKGLQQSRDWVKANPEKHAESRDNWKRANPGKVLAAVRKRQCAKLQRTPPWADFRAIAEIYEESARLTEETGIPHNVDHDIPLQGEFVSGLHVENNLVIMEAVDNNSKGNKYEN